MTQGRDDNQVPLDLTLTIKEAAVRCGVAVRTIRRRLDLDAFPNAYRAPNAKGEAIGAWRLPIVDLEAAGLPLLASTAPTPVVVAADPLAAMTTRADAAERRLEVLEAVQVVLESENRFLRSHLAAITPGTPAVETTKKRWFGRSKKV